MSTRSTPGYLTPDSSNIWDASRRGVDNSDFESRLASKIASKLASRSSTKSSTPKREKPRLQIIPETNSRIVSPRGGIHNQLVKYTSPLQTPPRGWKTPPRHSQDRNGFVIPYPRQSQPVVRVVYTDGKQSAFVEAPMKEGTHFNFGGQFQFKY